MKTRDATPCDVSKAALTHAIAFGLLNVWILAPQEALANQPPSAPVVSGPSSGQVGQTLTFTLSANDPEGQRVRFGASWGDGSFTDPATQPFVPSGQPGTLSHAYSNAGTFTANFYAQDEGFLTSSPSPWTVTVAGAPPPPPPPPSSGFNTERVDDAGTGFGEFTDIARDGQDNLHLAYRAAGTVALKYVKRTGTTWGTPQIVDASGNVGRRVSIAVDGAGIPHVSYYDDTNQDLKYARLSGGSWQTSTVDGAGDVGLFSSIAVDGSGRAKIAYKDQTNGDVKFATFNGSSWSLWPTVDAEGDVGEYLSLALDSAGTAHISYYDATQGDLKHAKWTGSAWSVSRVDVAGDVGNYSSIAIDASAVPAISYIDLTNGALKYAKLNGGAWELATVDSGNLRDVTSMAVDGAGNPHICYNRVLMGPPADWDLKYARLSGGSWSVETVESAGNVGDYCSLALDGAGKAHLSYLDADNTDVKAAHQK